MRGSSSGGSFEIAIFLIIIIGFIIAIFLEKRRKDKIKEYGIRNGIKYIDHSISMGVAKSGDFKITSHGGSFTAILEGKKNDINFKTMDYEYSVGSGKNRRTYSYTICVVYKRGVSFPHFLVRKENRFLDYLGEKLGGQDIDFAEDKSFSDKFVLQGDFEDEIREFFTRKVRSAFVAAYDKFYTYEASGIYFIAYINGKQNINERINTLSDTLKLYYSIMPDENQYLS